MKLYTEYHLKEAYFRGVYNGINHIQGGYFDVQDSLTPIELPSDEEIAKMVGRGGSDYEGAIWMKNEILNQNK